MFSASDKVNKCEGEEKQRSYQNRPHARADWWERFHRKRYVDVACAGSADDVWVALSGIAVAAFTFTLWQSTDRLWKSAENQRRDDKSRRLFDDIRQNRVLSETRKAANAATDQSKLARQEFYIVHRPRLRIRNAELKHGQTVIELPDGIKPVHKIGLIDGEPIECHFTVANVGGTTATIIECDAYLVQKPINLTGRPYDGRNPPDVQPLTPGTQIEASGSRRAFFVDLAGLSEIMVTSLTADAQGDHPKSIPKLSLYLIGYVRYADATGAKRRTAFCRLYDITERRFKRLAEPDEDYENEE